MRQYTGVLLLIFLAGFIMLFSSPSRSAPPPAQEDLSTGVSRVTLPLQNDALGWPQSVFSPTQLTRQKTPLSLQNDGDGTVRTPPARDTPQNTLPKILGGETRQSAAAKTEATFHTLYPIYFTESLKDLQDLVSKNSPAETTHFSFSSEPEIVSFLGTFINFSEERELISGDEAEKLHTSLIAGAFKQAKDSEKATLGVTAQPSSDFFAWIKNITTAILPPKAYAALWSTLPLCYKNTGPAAPGVTLFATSCNAGFHATPNHPPIPVADCGPESARCTIPTGCLNLVCKASPNAIWDPRTGICGCG